MRGRGLHSTFKKAFLRNAEQAVETPYVVRFTDYTGANAENYWFASDAMFRFQQLAAFPGCTDVSWETPQGVVMQQAKEGNPYAE